MRQPPILFSYAFRVFFLLCGAGAIVLVLAWMASMSGSAILAATENPLYWHGHEMIVGFAMATVAGFALTAVATWTGRRAIAGSALMGLALAWLLGRLAMAGVLGPNDMMTGVIDMLFPVSLAAVFGREVVAARNARNYKVVAMIGALAGWNLLYHLGHPYMAIYLMIHTMLLLVAVIGGRIVPSFTANWMRGRGLDKPPVNNPVLDRMAISATIMIGLVVVFYPSGVLVGYLSIAGAALHAVRVGQWRGLRTVGNPLLLVLHAAYWWLPAGYAIMGLASLGVAFTPTAALHALTMGAIGTMVFAMVTRVPLGHTGRPLQAARLTVVAYFLLTASVLIRIASPWNAESYLSMVNLAAAGWCLAFLIFLWVYWPVLTRPRVRYAELTTGFNS